MKAMEPEGKKFGRGPREVGGAVDLINWCKLCSHHEFFCKRTLPLSLSETRYLQNVVGDTEIRKGEGMELDQLLQKTSYLGKRETHICSFDLDILREAFQMTDSTPILLSSAEKGIPTAINSKGRSKDEKRMYKKHKDKNHSKHKNQPKNGFNNKNKNISGHHDSGSEHLKKEQDKKRRHDWSENTSMVYKQ